MYEPARSPWVAAIHAGNDRKAVTGVGVVIDKSRVLTCFHVVTADGRMRPGLVVSLPLANLKREQFFAVGTIETIEASDLAIINLNEELDDQALAAPLAWPAPTKLAGRPWWGFGLKGDHGTGDGVEGHLGSQKGLGLIGIGDGPNTFPAHNLAGAGIWSPDQRAVVGLAVHPPGPAEQQLCVISLHQLSVDYPELRLTDLSTWQSREAYQLGVADVHQHYSPVADPSYRRHWHPKSRGVLHIGHDLFQGRSTALTAIRAWLARPRTRSRVLVVTGMPGSGKSAVLSRIITTSETADETDAQHLASSPIADHRYVSCAVHAKGKDHLQVMQEIAQGAGLMPPSTEEDFLAQVVAPLASRRGPFNIIIDALDEAATSSEARAIVRSIVIPMHEEAGNIQIVVGSRRSDAEGPLIAAIASAADIIDLDDSEFFNEQDVTLYVEAILRLERPNDQPSPYTASEFTSSVARRISELAGKNFLIAGLVANHHRMHDTHVASPGQITFASRVTEVLNEYIKHLALACPFARAAMTSLAMAEAAGLTLSLWREATHAMGEDVSELELANFANHAAAYLIESTDDGGDRNYQLFHPALAEALLESRAHVMPRHADEQRIVQAWLGVANAGGWANAPSYLLRWLPRHAQRADMVDQLLENDEFVLHVDRSAMLQAGLQSNTPLARARARILQLATEPASMARHERWSVFTVTQALHCVDGGWSTTPEGSRYKAAWAQANPAPTVPLIAHSSAIAALGSFNANAETLLATGDEGGSIRVSNLATCMVKRDYESPDFRDQTAGCVIESSQGALLAVAGKDDSIRLVHTETGEICAVLTGHVGQVSAVTSVTIAERRHIVSGSYDGTVRIWDETGASQRILHTASSWITALSAYEDEGSTVVVAGAVDGTVWQLDAVSGNVRQTLAGHHDRIAGVHAVRMNDRRYIASASTDRTVRLWHLRHGHTIKVLEHDSVFSTACALDGVEDAQFATADTDGAIHIWDLNAGTAVRLPAHDDRVTHMCQVRAGSHTLLVTAGEDGSVLRWDLAMLSSRQQSQTTTNAGSVKALCVAEHFGRARVLSAGAFNRLDQWDLETGFCGDQLELIDNGGVSAMCLGGSGASTLYIASGGLIQAWDLRSRRWLPNLGELPDPIHALATANSGDSYPVISGGADGIVRIWQTDPTLPGHVMTGHTDAVTSLTTFNQRGRLKVVSGSADATIRIWDPEDIGRNGSLVGHQQAVTALETFGLPWWEGTMLASGGEDANVRLWNPETCELIDVLEGHQGTITSMAAWQRQHSAFLATASSDMTLRIWDLQRMRCAFVIPTGYRCQAVIHSDKKIVVGLDVGMLALDLSEV